MDGKRGDSVDVTQQWREVTSDQHRLVRSRSSEPANIPAEEINMKHKQSQRSHVEALLPKVDHKKLVEWIRGKEVYGWVK